MSRRLRLSPARLSLPSQGCIFCDHHLWEVFESYRFSRMKTHREVLLCSAIVVACFSHLLLKGLDGVCACAVAVLWFE